jgi:hypothetical protein
MSKAQGKPFLVAGLAKQTNQFGHVRQTPKIRQANFEIQNYLA